MLRATRDAGVKRVVLTSAFGAIGFGYGRTDHQFTEEDWTILDGPGVSGYNKSKTIAERAAWDFVTAEGSSMELVTLNPVRSEPVSISPVGGSAVSRCSTKVAPGRKVAYATGVGTDVPRR